LAVISNFLSGEELDRIGEALTIQQINILDLECLKLELEEKAMVPGRLRETVDHLLGYSVKTSRILLELGSQRISEQSRRAMNHREH
jgi:hypothetical protein